MSVDPTWPEPELHNADQTVSGSQLRSWAPLVRMDAVRSGDIVLTRGRTVEARVIARMSGGRWSHAALWVPIESRYRSGGIGHWSDLQLIEADDIGTGPTELRVVLLRLGGETVVAARLPGDPEDAVLLRHPGIDCIQEEAFDEALQALTTTALYRSYPPLDRLVGATSLPPALKSVFRNALAVVYRTAQNAPRRRLFCSELAARFYGLLGLSPFEPGFAFEPEDVSPNYLAGSRSVLRPVAGAVLSAANIGDEAGTALFQLSFFRRETLLAVMVKQNEEESADCKSMHRTGGRGQDAGFEEPPSDGCPRCRDLAEPREPLAGCQ